MATVAPRHVINILHLIQEGLLNLPITYLSRHVIAHKTDYYGLLLGDVTRDQAWEPWLLFAGAAVAQTSRWTTGKISAIRRLAEDTTEHVRARLPKIYTRRPGGRDLRAALLPHRQPGGQGHRPARRPHAICTIWLTWACCEKCRSARRSSSSIPN
ncbi:MAG: hypothetical protein U0Q55_24090 [Vicinamibacterales bacterium]